MKFPRSKCFPLWRRVKIDSELPKGVDEEMAWRSGTAADAAGKRARTGARRKWRMPLWTLGLSYFLVEVYAFVFLATVDAKPLFSALRTDGLAVLPGLDAWPLAFGLLWAAMLTGLVRLLPALVGRIVYGVTYFLAVIYAGVQTGYFLLFREMLWMSDFRYASEGSDYFSVLLRYPLAWWLCLAALLALGIVLLVCFPGRKRSVWRSTAAGVAAVGAAVCALLLPQLVFLQDRSVRYAGSDYGRMQSAEAAYDNMFNAYRLYQVCGVYQTGVKDIYANLLAPLLPGHAHAQEAAKDEIDDYFSRRGAHADNEMTGIFAGKNVVLVLMESMDDWAIGTHTPTINRLMAEGINFTNFYTPGYGGVRTFNSEFCANTGSFLSSAGGYAFDYVTNDYRQSLANVLAARGYSAKTYHYNSPAFYSRGVFEPAMGYEEYISYADYVESADSRDLYDDQFLFDNAEVSASFFRAGQKLNFIITRSAHLNYVYNEVLSYWGLQKYPQYRGLTGIEEEDCMYLKARLVDDMFARLLTELAEHGELENTVIVAFTDHYTYGIEDQSLVWERSGVDDALLVEKTPCFIWSADGPAMQVEKTLNTADLLPTVLNLLGVEQTYSYLGQDAFDDGYAGYALFPNGSWVYDGVAYNAATKRTIVLRDGAEADDALRTEMAGRVNEFVRINNLILQTDYYAEEE